MCLQMSMSVSSPGCATMGDAGTLRARTTVNAIGVTSWSGKDIAKVRSEDNGPACCPTHYNPPAPLLAVLH